MKNNHYIMRSMRKNLREDEKRTNDTFCESSNLFQRLVTKVINEKSEIKPMRFKKQVETEKVVQKHAEAAEKTVRASNTAWMKKRGSYDENKESQISKIIFSMLDPEGKDEISGEVLVKFLLELGLVIHPRKLKEAIVVILKKEHTNFKLKHEDISFLCKGDHRTSSVTKCINEEVKNQRLMVAESMKTDNSVIKVTEQLAILTSWWNYIDKTSRNQVSVNMVAEFLVTKSIVGDSYEGRRLVKDFSNDTQFIDKDQFLNVFSKALIRWVLINVHTKFTEEDWKNTDHSPAFKITCLQRNLILAGLKCQKNGISQEDGSLVINAIERFRKYSNNPVEKISFNQFVDYWGEVISSKSENKTKQKCRINSLDKIVENYNRPSSVPNEKIDAENSFYQEFQNFVNSQ